MSRHLYQGSYREAYIVTINNTPDIPGRGDGIFHYEFDPNKGVIKHKDEIRGLLNPATLYLSNNHKFMYAGADTRDFVNFEHSKGSGMYSIAIDKNGCMELVDSKPTFGIRPLALATDKTDEYLVVANTGSVFCTTSFVREKDGVIRPHIYHDEGCLVLFKVKDGNFVKTLDRYVLEEGEPAHPRSIIFTDDDIIIVANEGGNCIDTFKFNRKKEKLEKIMAFDTKSFKPSNLTKVPGKDIFFCTSDSSTKIFAFSFDKNGKIAKKAVTKLDKGHVKDLQICIKGEKVFVLTDKPELIMFKVDEKFGLKKIGSTSKALEKVDSYINQHINYMQGYVFTSLTMQNKIAIYKTSEKGLKLHQIIDAATPAGLAHI